MSACRGQQADLAWAQPRISHFADYKYTGLASSNQPIQGRGTDTMHAMQPLAGGTLHVGRRMHTSEARVSMQAGSRNLHTVGSADCIFQVPKRHCQGVRPTLSMSVRLELTLGIGSAQGTARSKSRVDSFTSSAQGALLK